MDKTIISFLRKEPMATKVSNTDGYKLFFKDTCVGQWKETRVLLNNTGYGEKEIDSFITRLQKWARKSEIIYTLCTNAVPLNSKDLRKYE